MERTSKIVGACLAAVFFASCSGTLNERFVPEPAEPEVSVETVSQRGSQYTAMLTVQSENQFASYALFRWQKNDDDTLSDAYTEVPLESSKESLNVFKDSGLSASGVYVYRARTKWLGKESRWSEDRELTVYPPTAPQNVTLTARSSSSILISWEPVEGATGYTVYSGRNNIYDSNWIGTVAAGETSFTHTASSFTTTPVYHVEADFGGYKSEKSSNAYFAAPQNLRFVPSDSSFTLSWDAVPNNCIVQIDYSGLSDTHKYTQNCTGDEYTIQGLSEGTAYYFWVYGVYAGTFKSNPAGGEYSYSTSALLYTKPASSTALALVADSWQKGTASGGSQFYAFKVTNGKSYYIKCGDLVDSASYTAEGISLEVWYESSGEKIGAVTPSSSRRYYSAAGSTENAFSFTADRSDTVIIKVSAKSGTFGLWRSE